MEDLPVIARFNSELASESEGKRLDPETISKGVAAVLGDPGKGIYFVAEIGGRVVGQLMVTYEWSDWRNGTFWWVQSVFVEPRFRGQGVFKELTRYVTAEAQKDHGCCGLRLYAHHENLGALETYRRLGFKKTDYEMFELSWR
jgi:ribosomal protein S18 acetylase RimI-like enzyme